MLVDPICIGQLDSGYLRINPSVGVIRIADTVDLTADADYLQVEGGTQYDAGLTVVVEPPESPLSIDTSVRAIIAPTLFPGPTYYADLYVNVVSVPLDLLLIAGGEITSEPDLAPQASTGIGGFLRVAKYLRPPRRAGGGR